MPRIRSRKTSDGHICGSSFEPDDISGMVNFILEVADNEELHTFDGGEIG